jgi:hypothetical protein
MFKFSLNSCLFFTFQYITNEGTVFTFKTNLNSPRYKLINIDFSKPEMISLKYSFVFYSASLLMGHKHFFDFPLLIFVQNLFLRKTFFIFLFFYYIVLYSTLSNIKITQSALHLKKTPKKIKLQKAKSNIQNKTIHR